MVRNKRDGAQPHAAIDGVAYRLNRGLTRGVVENDLKRRARLLRDLEKSNLVTGVLGYAGEGTITRLERKRVKGFNLKVHLLSLTFNVLVIFRDGTGVSHPPPFFAVFALRSAFLRPFHPPLHWSESCRLFVIVRRCLF